ncbi:HAD family hydrolase [Corynebacterium lowii]|uniref:Phosphoglycolate phosphatase n=1 Tax=Corynebacterium lowii TaxID=1544413 RepID=A0A0Q0YXN0_9CORY|nr:HAD family hydrolase [Corynebacterium lowii]KQB87121.1 Phosphoglycolate phosphatase [Corynebacterium lowii]MDP9852293.1 putative hydrolase of the HAD superfamily [Corynebacterium lowii]
MRGLIVDLHGVLLSEPDPTARRRLEETVGAGRRAPEFWEVYADLRPPLEAGEVSAAHYWNQVRLRANLPYFDVAAAQRADRQGCAEAQRETVEFFLGLGDDGWRWGILANIPHDLAEEVRARHAEWLECCAAVVFSCDIGVRTPHPEAYAVALDAMGAHPSTTVLCSARAENLEGARRAGMQALAFTGLDAVRAELGGL